MVAKNLVHTLHSLSVYDIDAIVVIDEKGQIKLWNPMAEELLGYSKEEALGKDIIQLIIPQEYHQFYLDCLPQLLDQQTDSSLKATIEIPAQCASGEKIPAEILVFKNGQGPLRNEYTLIIRDATEKKELEDLLEEKEKEIKAVEERYRMLVGGIQDYAIFMLDPQGNVASWNAGSEKIKGYTEEEIIGKHFAYFYTTEDVDHGKPYTELTKAKNLGRYEDEGWRVRKDGSKFWANVVISAFRNEEGQLIGFSKITRDLTHRKQLEDELIKTRSEAEAAHLKNTFLTHLSRKLKPPIQIITSYAQLFEKEYGERLKDNHKRYLSNIILSGHNLLNLISEMKELAQIQAGQIKLSLEWVDLKKLMSDTQKQVNALASLKNVTLNVYIQPDLKRLEADPKRLREILWHLLSTAIKMNQSGGNVRLTISKDEDNRWVIFEIQTCGTEIPPYKLSKFFSEFSQIDSSQAQENEGTGLELALTKHFIELHGGTITVESVKKSGLLFRFNLPYQNQADK